MSNNKQQTAVEWLISQMPEDYMKSIPFELAEQAKEMEKEQIMKAYVKALPIEDGVFTAVQKAEQYYKETYNNNDRNSS
jgi:hypothetical protein